MNEKKHIDRLFQEKFKDFEVAPPEFVWENIQEKLQEKKKRRVVPLWIRLSGVAAVFVVGSMLVVPLFNDGIDQGDAPVVIDNNGAGQQSPVQAAPETPQTDVLPDGQNQPAANPATAVATGEETQTGTATPADVNVNRATTAPVRTQRLTQQNSAVAAESHSINRNTGKRDRQNASSQNNGTGLASATTGAGANNNATVQPAGSNNAERIRQNAVQTPQEAAYNNAAAVAGNSAGNTAPTDGDNAAPRNIHSNPDKAVAGTDAINEVRDNSVNRDAVIKEEALAVAPADTAMAAPQNELEKLLQQQLNDKEEEVADKSGSKWNIRPQVAPVFYNSLTNGSPINQAFASNAKSYENDLSYGVGIDYAVNDRLSIRVAANSLNLSYATEGVQFFQSPTGASGGNIEPASPASLTVDTPGTSDPNFIIGTTPTSALSGQMVQSTSYIEVPMEMSYAMFRKESKFGLNVIGGFSTLFLNENNITAVTSQGLSSEMGKASNLNDIHFTTNVGVGFSYKFSSYLKANFEPMFKYQVNPYSRDAGNFNPFFIGLYSEISISF